MMNHRYELGRRLAPLLLAALLPACASSTPVGDRRFGDAVRIAKAQQVANPGAAANRDPVAGLDGRSARAIMERYQKSFSAPEAASNTFTIGVSGGK